LVHSKRNKQNKCALKRIPYKRANEPLELLKEEVWRLKAKKKEKTQIEQTTNALLVQGRIMARVNSPHCIALKAAYEDDRSLYLVMELARGGDLYASVMRRRKRYTEEQASFYHQLGKCQRFSNM
jgi:serine/threonine protein kinase